MQLQGLLRALVGVGGGLLSMHFRLLSRWVALGQGYYQSSLAA